MTKEKWLDVALMGLAQSRVRLRKQSPHFLFNSEEVSHASRTASKDEEQDPEHSSPTPPSVSGFRMRWD